MTLEPLRDDTEGSALQNARTQRRCHFHMAFLDARLDGSFHACFTPSGQAAALGAATGCQEEMADVALASVVPCWSVRCIHASILIACPRPVFSACRSQWLINCRIITRCMLVILTVKPSTAIDEQDITDSVVGTLQTMLDESHS